MAKLINRDLNARTIARRFLMGGVLIHLLTIT